MYQIANAPEKDTLVSMRTLLWIVLCADFIFLLMIGSMKLEQYNMSEFAFKERVKGFPAVEVKRWKRLFQLLPRVYLLQSVELVIAATIFVTVLTSLKGSLVAVVGGLLGIALIRVVSRLRVVQNKATELFETTLDVVLRTTELLQPLWWILGVPARSVAVRPETTNELLDQLRKYPATVLDNTQKQRVQTVIESQTKTVKDVMTSKRMVTSVKPHSTLGPVLLSDLQKTGHGYFPVYEKKAEPEGLLDISDLSDIHTAKQRQTVRDIMNSQLVWVEEETSIEELVQAFLQEKQYLLFVRNLDGDFSGIVTVADLLKQLIGAVKD